MATKATTTVNEPVYDFDFIRDPDVMADVHAGYWKLKENAPPVFWTPRNGGHWVVTDSGAAIEVLRHPEKFSSRNLAIPSGEAKQKMIPVTLDPPEHRPYRQLLRPYFESKAIEHLTPQIQEWADKLIDDVAAKGECEFVDVLGSRFPVSVFMELFGFPLDKFDFFRDTVVEYFNAQVDFDRRNELSMQIVGNLVQLIELRRAEPKEDLISSLLDVDFEGRKLDDEELISIGFLMFLAGLDTVVNALSFGMRHLAHDEKLRTQLIEGPDTAPAIVEELMRRYSFVSVPRLITQDTIIGDVQVHAGESVLVPLAMVGWDEKMASCPAEVRLDRQHCRHAAFGSGVHTCLGIHLARLEMSIFYSTWAKKIGHFEEADKGPLTFRGGHVQALEELHLKWDAKP